ncbi:MAG: hypothetical protein KAS23_05040 [Anaerohalosphaera sp.]|nr:hypothetical protein [Anaerohalosphaera sp.]
MKDSKNTSIDLIKENRKSISRIANKIYKILPKAFTYDPLLDCPPKFRRDDVPFIYIVSLKGYEARYTKRPTLAEIKAWVRLNYQMLCVSGHYIGVWWYEGYYYLDISIAVFGEARALAIASANHQVCIFHLASKRDIPVPEQYPKAS